MVWARQVTGPAAAARGAVYFSRTTNGGATWSAARAIYQTPLGMQTSANQIVVLPDGDLLDVFNQLGQGKDFDHPRHDTITAIRSSDRGLTWSGPSTLATNFVNGVTDPHTGQPVRDGDDFTEIAVDPRPGTSNVYAVWGDARFTNGGPQQIAFTRSADGGRTWSQPIRVSANVKTQAFVPAVAVDGHGDLAVAYYDFSADRPASQFLATQYWITLSTNQGRTWSPRQQVTAGRSTCAPLPSRHTGGSSWANIRAWPVPGHASSWPRHSPTATPWTTGPTSTPRPLPHPATDTTGGTCLPSRRRSIRRIPITVRGQVAGKPARVPAVTLACSSPRLRADAAPEWMICMRPTACCGTRPIVPGAHRQAASLTQPVGRAPAEWSFGIASAEPCGP